MRALLAVVLAALAFPVPHPADAPEPFVPLPVPVPPEVGEGVRRGLAEAEAATGVNATLEDVNVSLRLNFQDVDVDLPGILFGGGRVYAFVRAEVQVDFRTIGFKRVHQVVQEAAGGANVSLADLGLDEGEGTIPADVLRGSLAGEALDLFKAQEEDLLVRYLQRALPDVTVLAAEVDWLNDSPVEFPPDDRPREPPLVLNASVTLQYLDRVTLLDLLERARKDDDEAGRTSSLVTASSKREDERLLERLKEANRAPLHDRNVFSVLGLEQLVRLGAEPGWRVNLTVDLPAGFTFESVTPGITTDPSLRTARTDASAKTSDRPLESASVLAVSNRFLVTVTLLVATLVAGFTLQVPVGLVASRVVQRRLRHRRGT